MDNYISIGVGNSMCGASMTSIIYVKGYHYACCVTNTNLVIGPVNGLFYCW